MNIENLQHASTALSFSITGKLSGKFNKNYWREVAENMHKHNIFLSNYPAFKFAIYEHDYSENLCDSTCSNILLDGSFNINIDRLRFKNPSKRKAIDIVVLVLTRAENNTPVYDIFGGDYYLIEAGDNKIVNNEFNSISDLTGWEFTLPWNSTHKTTDYTLSDGLLTLQMLAMDKGGHVLSPSFSAGSKVRFTTRHFMHKGDSVFLPALWLTNETAVPSSTAQLQHLEINFQNSSWSPDYACSAPDIPRIQSGVSCIPKLQEQSTTTSSSLYEKWITTVITYDSDTGLLEIDYESDGIFDFVGVVPVADRFKPTRIAIGTYGWYTGHYHIIDSVRIDSVN